MIGQVRCVARSICGHWGLGRAWANLGAPQKLGTLVERFPDWGISPAPVLPQQLLLGLNIITHKLSLELPCRVSGVVKIGAGPGFRRKIIRGWLVVGA